MSCMTLALLFATVERVEVHILQFVSSYSFLHAAAAIPCTLPQEYGQCSSHHCSWPHRLQ